MFDIRLILKKYAFIRFHIIIIRYIFMNALWYLNNFNIISINIFILGILTTRFILRYVISTVEKVIYPIL